MSLIIVRKRNSDQDQQRNDRENNNTHDRKCQQCDIEFVILELLQVFYKRIDMFSCLPGYVTGQMNVGRCSEQLLKIYINMKKGEGRE